MGFYKSLNFILRNNIFSNIVKQRTSNCFQSFFVPRKVLLYMNINSYLSFERCTNIKKMHTSQSLNKKSAAEEIQHLADLIVTENSNELCKQELIKVLDFLVSKGYKISNIKDKCLNFLTPSNSSYIKVLQIAELGSDILELIPFMNLSLQSLRNAAQQAKEDKHEITGFPNRILYLTHHLETPIEELIPALTKHSSLLTMPFSRLDHKMNVLKSAEINPQDLVKDLWIFNYNEMLLSNRISAAEKAGLKLKPWMLRCSNKFFVSKLNKDTETQRILEGDDIVKYLSTKLDCSEEYVKHLMAKNRLLKTINTIKINQIIHFLFEKGYTPQEVRLCPRVFSAKIETLDQRLLEYQKVRSTLPPIPQLCAVSEKFQNNLKKYKKGEGDV